MSDEPRSKWLAYCENELRLTGAGETFYGDRLPKAVMELAEVFNRQGHSGMSAEIVSQLFRELTQWHPLSPLTDDPAEWNEVGQGEWQSRRRPDAFSIDGGKHYRITGKDEVHVSKHKGEP